MLIGIGSSVFATCAGNGIYSTLKGICVQTITSTGGNDGFKGRVLEQIGILSRMVIRLNRIHEQSRLTRDTYPNYCNSFSIPEENDVTARDTLQRFGLWLFNATLPVGEEFLPLL